jgi:hypothetical protein
MKALKFVVPLYFLLVTAVGAPARAAQDEGIPPGTVITPQNWQNYKRFMPYGLQALFGGKYFWKFPADFQMQVGPTQHYSPPPAYQEYTKKYSGQVRIVSLPDGGHSLTGYVAGEPFPNPTEPMKGYKILANVWYTWIPYLQCNAHLELYFEDRYESVKAQDQYQVYRRLSHIGDAGQPLSEPAARGVDFSEYLEVVAPEQAKYTTDLTLYYVDLMKPEDTFLFIPSLRRTLRLSSAARCSPVIGSDYTHDDNRASLWNGGLVRFDSNYLGDMQVLSLIKANPVIAGDPDNYYHPVFFPKPAVGKWEVRDSWVIDIRRIPSQSAGYCYGKRIMFVDKEIVLGHWTDFYDSNMKFWKTSNDPESYVEMPGEGLRVMVDGWTGMWDFQNDHLTAVMFEDAHGHGEKFGDQCSNVEGHNFADLRRYASIAGLSEIMK